MTSEPIGARSEEVGVRAVIGSSIQRLVGLQVGWAGHGPRRAGFRGSAEGEGGHSGGVGKWVGIHEKCGKCQKSVLKHGK